MSEIRIGKGKDWSFRGFCLGVPAQNDMDIFKRLITEVMPEYKCNALVLLIRYRYQFKSHPEVADRGALTGDQAAELVDICRESGIRLIPKMNLMGHQSEKKRGSEQGLLRAFPEFDETPEMDEVRYCRSLCPLHPEVSDVVFDLADEIIEAFNADAIHVGLDEVFEIGKCPRCKDINNAKLFTDWVNTLHSHLTGEKNAEMFVWGDRFLDGESTGYGEWEASRNDTWSMVDDAAKDIVICDWHYGVREQYPSVPYFTGKGFRLLACPWRNIDATKAFAEYLSENMNDRVMGVLQTSWCNAGMVARYLCDEDDEVEDVAKQVGESFKFLMTF
ncbi:family 20 glycosylhydrolase [Candidatus Poribacteria bacterium]|nr:family 20 glycosylhydrolase [Candidatus Poribacteria bacterium]